MTLASEIEALRNKALREAIDPTKIAMVVALDRAVAAAGGKPLLPDIEAFVGREQASKVIHTKPTEKRISQGDAAEMALREYGPLPVGRLLEKAAANGATIGGEKPLISFRSMLSKDDRFYSLVRNNMYFWWLKGVDLPEGFRASELPNIEDLLGSKAAHSNDGTGDNAPTRTENT